MNVRHQKIMMPDACVTASTLRTAMDVDVLTKDIVIADRQKSFFTFKLQILRLKADGSEGVKLIVFADFRRTFDDDVRIDAAPTTDPDASANATVGADRHVLGDVRFRTDDSSRVDHGC
jgi:hypothetical protein